MRSRVVVGSYTQDLGWVNGKSDGLYVLEYEADGRMKVLPGPAMAASDDVGRNMTYLACGGGFVFAVDERIEFEDGGRLIAFTQPDIDGKMRLVAGPAPCVDASSCHLAVLDDHVLVANYCGSERGVGSLAALRRQPTAEGLQLGAAQRFALPGENVAAPVQYPGYSVMRQDKAHAHSVLVTRSKTVVLVADLGSDVVWRLDYSPEKGITSQPAIACRAPPGGGPRHTALHPSLNVFYVLYELSKQLASYVTDDDGVPAQMQPFALAYTVDDRTVEATTSALRVHPNGLFVYSSNRVVDAEGSIACFRLDATTGAPVESSRVLTGSGGRIPREILLVDNGRLLLVANQDTDTVLSFAVDQKTGALTRRHQVHCKTPVCFCEVEKQEEEEEDDPGWGSYTFSSTCGVF